MRQLMDIKQMATTFKKRYHYLFFSWVLLAGAMLLTVDAQAQAKVKARMEAAKISVGDQVRIFLTVDDVAPTDKLEWASIPDTFNRLEVVERSKIDTVKTAAGTQYKQRLVITGFDSGVFVVPAFQFPLMRANGTPSLLVTDSMQLEVATVAVDTTQAFKPIKGVIAVETSWMDYIWYIVGALVLIIATVAGVMLYMKRKPQSPPPPPAPKEPLHVLALRQLTALEEKQLWQKDKVKEYYVELTDIVRGYIEERFNTPVLELTTDELMQKVQRHRDLQSHYVLLSHLLTTADLAKFAKAKPLAHEHTDAMEKAKLFVSSTPVVIVEPQPENKA